MGAPHYQNYVNAIKSQSYFEQGPFKEFQPRDPVAQAKYSAMSPTWEGVESSEAAVARGDYALDTAEKNRQDLRAKAPQKQMPLIQPQPEPQSSWNCSIQ